LAVDLYEREGRYLDQSRYWSNHSTSTRIRFESGFGTVRALFSYPRFPSWFRRRWILAFDADFDEAVGQRLFTRALERSRARSCHRLEIESQNINIPAYKL
jgi:hypothetical protein